MKPAFPLIKTIYSGICVRINPLKFGILKGRGAWQIFLFNNYMLRLSITHFKIFNYKLGSDVTRGTDNAAKMDKT